MEFIVPAICGILLILGIVAIVMSRSNWKIPQMILVFFILVFSLAYFYMAARNLRSRENWEKEVHEYVTKTEETRKGNQNNPESAQIAIEQLTQKRAALRREALDTMAERGRVWPDAIGRADKLTGKITASFDQQDPKGLDPKSIVFVFEEADKEKDKGGKYLGEFTVETAAGKQVTLLPAGSPVSSELNTIGSSKGPWVLYEIMPIDSHTLLTKDAEAEASILKLLPEASREEYSRDQRPAKYDLDKSPTEQPKGNDSADRVQVRVKFLKPWPEMAAAPMLPAAGAVAPVPPAGAADAAKNAESQSFKPGDVAYLDVEQVGGKKVNVQQLQKDGIIEYEKSDPAKFLVYSRPLRDYARSFREAYRQRNELLAEKATFDAQVQQIDAAKKQVDADIEAANTQKEGLTKDLAKFKDELASVTAFNKTLDTKIAETRAKLSDLFKRNLILSAQLAEAEKRLYDAIRAKTPPAEVSASARP